MILWYTGKKMTDFTLKPNDNLLAVVTALATRPLLFSWWWQEIKNWFVEIAKKDEFDTMADIDGDGQVTEVLLNTCLDDQLLCCESRGLSQGYWINSLLLCQNEAALWSKRRGDQGHLMIHHPHRIHSIRRINNPLSGSNMLVLLSQLLNSTSFVWYWNFHWFWCL